MRKLGAVLVFAGILAGGWFFRNDILDFYSKLFLRLPQIEEKVSQLVVKEAKKEIFTPPPLRAKKEDPEALLTSAGVIKFTNLQRKKYGLPLLRESEKLNLSAKLKVEDMFEKQYFSHFSPTGEGVGDWVKLADYEFIAIGENLALGNFKNDEVLVQGWMDSPGHRENILNEKYQEIGLVVQKGVFEGKTVWLSVQHFGLPLSVCHQPDEKIRVRIGTNQEEIGKMQKTLEELEAEIKTIRPRREKEVFIQKTEQYSALVSQYNALVEETIKLVNQYNSQVNLFNQCVAEGE